MRRAQRNIYDDFMDASLSFICYMWPDGHTAINGHFDQIWPFMAIWKILVYSWCESALTLICRSEGERQACNILGLQFYQVKEPPIDIFQNKCLMDSFEEHSFLRLCMTTTSFCIHRMIIRMRTKMMMMMGEQRPSTGFPKSMLGVGRLPIHLISSTYLPSIEGEHVKT